MYEKIVLKFKNDIQNEIRTRKKRKINYFDVIKIAVLNFTILEIMFEDLG